jgi:hypothetical protein
MNRTDAKQIAKHIVTEVRKATYPYTSDNQFNANKAGSTTTTQTFSAEMLSYNIDITFVSTSYNTVTWYGGSTGIGTDASIVLSDGRTQVITQGSATLTGTNMNYLYITWGSPIVVVTTSDTGSIGKNKILLATAQANPDHTSSALILPFGNRVPTLNATAISANTIIANMIKAGTITVDKLAFTPVTGAVLTPGSAAYDINTNSTLISWDRIETPEIDAGMIIGGTLGQTITVGPTGAVSISAGSTAVIMNNTGIVGLSHIGSSQVTEFSISATTGQAICGAGAVTLDTDGITVCGAHLKLGTTSGSYFALMYMDDSTRQLHLDTFSQGMRTRSITPTVDINGHPVDSLGSITIPWSQVYAQSMMAGSIAVDTLGANQYSTVVVTSTMDFNPSLGTPLLRLPVGPNRYV